MGVPSERIVEAYYNVVDVQYWHDAVNAARARMTARSGHHAIFVGQLIVRKNIRNALCAWAEVRNPADTFTIVGEGPLRSGLEAVVRALGLVHVVRFAGHRNLQQLAEEYARSQTLVLPSKSEVWGLTVSEALAAGLHAVVSMRAGIAPAIAAMPGVFLSGTDVVSLAEAFRASRDSWRGPISTPEMLARTPESAALAVTEAIELAHRAHSRRRLKGGNIGR
jgi:glycosyltransferase involved in cell wall biosynthesis